MKTKIKISLLPVLFLSLATLSSCTQNDFYIKHAKKYTEIRELENESYFIIFFDKHCTSCRFYEHDVELYFSNNNSTLYCVDMSELSSDKETYSIAYNEVKSTYFKLFNENKYVIHNDNPQLGDITNEKQYDNVFNNQIATPTIMYYTKNIPTSMRLSFDDSVENVLNKMLED